MSIENKLIDGYQFGEHNQFIGVYQFPNNLDKEEIHLPPNTTLVSPPNITDNEMLFWDSASSEWIIKDKPEGANPHLPNLGFTTE